MSKKVRTQSTKWLIQVWFTISFFKTRILGNIRILGADDCSQLCHWILMIYHSILLRRQRLRLLPSCLLSIHLIVKFITIYDEPYFTRYISWLKLETHLKAGTLIPFSEFTCLTRKGKTGKVMQQQRDRPCLQTTDYSRINKQSFSFSWFQEYVWSFII